MRLYSYVVKYDTGFAPNPFFGYCTLACCKPDIRRTAAKGDWVVGLTPKAKGNRILFYMRVDDVIESFADYWQDRRFRAKRPTNTGGVRGKCGDNIYEPLAPGEYRQHSSMHSDDDRENREKKEDDLSGIRILASETFAYFGSKAISLPPELQCLIVGRKYKCKFSDDVMAAFVRFAGKAGFGVFGAPTSWTDGEDSSSKNQACNAGMTGCNHLPISSSMTSCK